MWIQVIFHILVGVVVVPTPALAKCFDFNAKTVKPLHAVTDKPDSGKLETGQVWASTQSLIDKPIGQILKLLLDHNNTRSPRINEMDVEQLKDPNYLAHHLVKFVIKPFLFINIRWTEEWAYAIAAGTEENPSEVVVSYEKIDGTSHIEHLCGSIVLRKLGDAQTKVFLYEQAKATQRTAEDTLKGIEGTLKSLRENIKD